MRLFRHLPRFRAAYRQMATLLDRTHWSRAQIDDFQLARLNAVWGHAIAHVPHYRRLAGDHELPKQFASLDEFRLMVPVLPKSDVRAHPRDFLSERPERGRWHRTGGSTGMPMSTFWAAKAYRESLQMRYRYYAMWGVDIFDRAVSIWGHSASLVPGWKGRLAKVRTPVEDWLRNRLRLSAYHLGPDDVRGYLQQIEKFQPASIYGYSQAMYLLALEAEARGFDCKSLKLFTLTGEPAPAFIVEKVQNVFQVPATIEYGSIECGIIASEWTDRTLRVNEDVVMLETLPREDGRYELAVTMLNNPSFPLLRYSIADVTDAPLELPAQGFAILKNVIGRNNDFIVTRSGRFLHSARFDALFKHETKVIRRFRVRQRADGSLAVSLEVDSGRTLDLRSLRHKVENLVEGYPAELEIVDQIPQTPAGKHRIVMSQLATALRNRSTAGHAAPQADQSESIESEPNTSEDESQRAAPVDDRAPTDASGHGSSHVASIRAAVATPAPLPEAPSKAARLRRLIERPGLDFILEAHNGLSAKIAEESGFEAIWASGLSISATLGVRDSNEASWTQVLEVLDFMNDATRLPILVDGDTGYGNFNNMRRLVRKLEQRGIAGVCIEDKVFPKTNSFINGKMQSLADMDEFCGRIRAGKDAQSDGDFVVIARVEAFIAGWGLAEAIRRAEAYHAAGADAILIHSARRSADEVLGFKRAWGDRAPVVIVPTKYYATPTQVFREHGFSAVIWANHLMRACITAMQAAAVDICEEQSLVNVEDRIAPLSEVFRLQGAAELAEAEKRYLPKDADATRAIILAASRGLELGEMTAQRPKCMVNVSGKPILAHIVDNFSSAGVKDIHVVRGYMKSAVALDGITYHDNDEWPATREGYSLHCARSALEGNCIISFGDVLFKKYVIEELIETEVDFAIFADVDWRDSRNQGRSADYVTCSEDGSRRSFVRPVRLLNISCDLDPAEIHGEWMGFLKVSPEGARFLKDLLERLDAEGRLRTMRMGDVLREVLDAGKEVRVLYTAGHWFDVDSVDDVLAGSTFS